MSTVTSFPGGVLLGVGLMYFLDPGRGRRRRARIGEMATHAQHVERELVGKARRDAQHRVHGLAERVRRRGGKAPDPVIEERVRAHLGRVVSHPGAIEVEAHDGRVILRGAVLAREAEEILRCAGGVSGVNEVIDRLERHLTPGDIPALQGEGKRIDRPRVMWTPAVRVGAIGAGSLLCAYGWFARGGVVGRLLGVAGGALALRGAFNRPLGHVVGVSPETHVDLQKTITIDAPIRNVFDLWSKFETFPGFMEHVRDVELEIGGNRSRWTVDGPGGMPIRFEVEITALEPDRLIAWRTVPGQSVRHEGTVRFDDVDGSTRVHVQMCYRPLGGVVGHRIAHALRWDPKARMDDDLVRMKALLEQGRTRAHRERIDLADLQ